MFIVGGEKHLNDSREKNLSDTSHENSLFLSEKKGQVHWWKSGWISHSLKVGPLIFFVGFFLILKEKRNVAFEEKDYLGLYCERNSV